MKIKDSFLIEFDSSSPGFFENLTLHKKTLLHEVVDLFCKDAIVGLPSDTLYGLFTPLFTGDLERLHAIKGRSLDHPFLVVLPENYDLHTLVDFNSMPEDVPRQIERLWPGRRSLVMKKKASLKYPPEETIALRVPDRKDNPFFYAILHQFGRPLVAPSLNLHGRQPLDDPAEMKRDFSGKVDKIFFDRAFEPSGASEIWDLTGTAPRRLR